MAKVKALYSYTYDYEGSRITFKCGDEFQLLAKVNADWWHVRRWISHQGSQDIYIPAVYVKEVGDETNPLYQNMDELKKQMEDFKKKESSTPPPPTPRKPRHDRLGSDKLKTSSSLTAAVSAVSGVVVSPEHKKLEGESVVNIARKLAENLTKTPSSPDLQLHHQQEGGPSLLPAKPGSISPLIQPKRSQSTRRTESPVGHKLMMEAGFISSNIMPVAAKPRSHSINVRPVVAAVGGAERKERESVSPPEIVAHSASQPDEPTPLPSSTSSTVKTSKLKIPPPVLPKAGKPSCPKSVHMFSPTEGQSSTTEDPFSAALQNQLTEQMKKVKSVTTVGPTTTAGGAEPKAMGTAVSAEETSPNRKPVQNGALPHDSAVLSPSSSSSSPSFPTPQKYILPEGWTEHKTNEGHTYYYNAATGKSSWTRPPSPKKTTPTTSPTHQNGHSSNPLEKIAPRGWTKEINPLSQTPIYTNSRSGERWALAKDATGNFYYYNMSNSQQTVSELPDVATASMSLSGKPKQLPTHQENVDRLGSSATENEVSGPSRARTNSVPRVVKPDTIIAPLSPPPSLSQPTSSLPPVISLPAVTLATAQLEAFQHPLASMQLKKHGYLQRKKLFDAQGKRGKGGWQKVYISLDNFQLKFYSDHKIAIETTAKPLSTFHLLQATVCIYTKEKKVKTAFMVSSPFGEQFLLQTDTSPQMNDWYSTIQSCVHKANEDFKLHPDKYCDIIPDNGEISPRTPGGKHGHRRKASKDIHTVSVAVDEDEELDDMDLSDKSDRIRNRLRRLMAKRPQMETLQKKGIIEDPVFGADLARYCERKKVQVPQFLVQFMEHIERCGLDTVGLYRLSGNAASVQKLRCLVEQDESFDLDDPEWVDINIVTGCLKMYFRELPDALIPANQFHAFIDAAKFAPTPAQRVAGLAAQVKELPLINYCTLVTLMIHLRKVMDNGSVNKMHSQNVAIVFGPTLLRSEGDPFEMAKLTPVQNGIVELMLIEYDKMFTRKC